MPNLQIRVENLGKKFTITHKPHDPYTALRDVLTDMAKALCQRFASPSHHSRAEPCTEEFWALRNVSFEIKQGEVVGIIGPNGAGKSTLLKILSRITEPTTGTVRLKGRVASLLEVGTGFHPELTGRENIFLNGAILGMTRDEIKSKFDEIVAFAETEKFLDTPVKRYSSGMYVRLAFAVAAHLEPELLLIDEVLAVGDASFQKKCLGKMGQASSEGRTVLFVSHNMKAVRNLCPRALLIKNGSVVMDDDSDVVVSAYLRENLGISSPGESRWDKLESAPGDVVKLKAVRLVSRNGAPISRVRTNEPFGIQIEFMTLIEGEKFNVGVYLFNGNDIQVLTSIDNHDKWHDEPRPAGLFKTNCYFPSNLLAPGTHNVTVQIKRIMPKPTRIFFRVPQALTFYVDETNTVQTNIYNDFLGVVRPLLEWETQFSQTTSI